MKYECGDSILTSDLWRRQSTKFSRLSI